MLVPRYKRWHVVPAWSSLVGSLHKKAKMSFESGGKKDDQSGITHWLNILLVGIEEKGYFNITGGTAVITGHRA